MKVLIQGKQMAVTGELKSYVMERLVLPLTRFFDDSAAELRVEFGDLYGAKRGNDKECHLTFRMPMAPTIQIEERTPDPYASLDAASDRLIHIVHRELDRMHRRPGHHKYRPLGTTVAQGGIPGETLEHLRFSDEAQRLLETGTGITEAGHHRLGVRETAIEAEAEAEAEA